MQTKRVKVYKFDELSETAQETALSNIEPETSYIYDDAYETVKAFHDVFPTSEGSRSWIDFSTDSTPENILNLKGLRLRTYIINNFSPYLFKGKYYSLWSKTEKSFKHYKDGYPVLKTRHSKVIFDNSCTLTGTCYDMSLLQPIYDFIAYKDKPDYYSYMDFETLIGDCFQALERDIEAEVNYQNSDEGKRENLDPETLYLITGQIFDL